MSIATQITRLNNNIEAMKNTKQQIKDAVNHDFDIIANEQIENYDTLIENGLELYKQYIPPVETNQATELQVTDAMKCNSNKLELFGNTEQASYTGSNKLDISTENTTYTANNIRIEFNDTAQKIIFNGTSSVSGGTTIMNQPINLKTPLTLTPGTYYYIPQILAGTFSSAENSRINGISLRDGNGNSIVNINTPTNSTSINAATFTLTEEKTITAIRFYLTGALSFNNWELALSVATVNEWEKYVGRTA